jgi:hypothetical protein
VSEHLRHWFLTVVQGSLRVTLRLLSLVVPQSRTVVVSAFPETEGNAVEVARALLRRYDGRVVWLQEGPSPTAVRGLVDQGLVPVRKASVAGLLAYLRAEVVFFTHGLYGSPAPAPRKPIVNLWHGDGPKDSRPSAAHGGSVIRSTFVVGSTRLFSGNKAAAFGVPPGQVLVTGNPRTDQFAEPAEPAVLERLGITGDFVLWMPTFRRTRSVGAVRVWSESAADVDHDAALAPLLRGLRERGVQLVVKPHPMDGDQWRGDGLVTITDEDLAGAGTSLYAVLGRARGLVTDYSSVWVDFLLLDRPIAFLAFDRDTYARQLVPADTLDWVPGELVEPSSQPFAEFLADLDAHGSQGAAQRAEAAERIGFNPTRTAADDLITELARRGVLALVPSPLAGAELP